MAAKTQQQEKKVDTNMLKRLHRANTRKKLPWLDGRSSITSTPIISPPGESSIPRPEDLLSPLRIVSESHGGQRDGAGSNTHSRDRFSSVERSVQIPLGPSEPKQRLSVVHIEEIDMNIGGQLYSDNLVAVPDHLRRIRTRSLSQTAQRNVEPSPPRIIQTVQRSPSQPIPKPSVFERHSHRRLSNAIEGLEELVEEDILTTEHLHRTKHVEQGPARDFMTKLSPLQVPSEGLSQLSSEEQVRPEILVDKVVEVVHVSPLQMAEHTQPETIDWAYPKVEYDNEFCRRRPEFSGSSSGSSYSSSFRGRRRVRCRSSSDRVQLLPPCPIAITPRTNIVHVLRPKISRSHSRGRSRERRTSHNFQRQCRRRHRSWRSDNNGSRGSCKHHRHHASSDNSGSLEEERYGVVKKGDRRRYGEELHLRNTRHLFSLHRNHPRQPVARNWRTGKKRICALVTCLNTAVLGIIIGIYVSNLTCIFVGQPC